MSANGTSEESEVQVENEEEEEKYDDDSNEEDDVIDDDSEEVPELISYTNSDSDDTENETDEDSKDEVRVYVVPSMISLPFLVGNVYEEEHMNECEEEEELAKIHVEELPPELREPLTLAEKLLIQRYTMSFIFHLRKRTGGICGHTVAFPSDSEYELVGSCMEAVWVDISEINMYN